MQKGLISLAIGGIAIGITEFVMMGILPDIAHNLSISIPKAGHLISAYALGVVIGAPILVLFGGAIPPKKLLSWLMVLFTIFNLFSAFANSYETLFIARLLSGLPHGAFFGVGAVVASRIAKPGQAARAVSIMFAGLTIANIIGVPIGTYIGHNYNWRYTFGIVTIMGLITIMCIRLWLPEIPNTKDRKIKNELAFFKRLDAWLIILIIAIGFSGLFAWISYIAPLLTDVAHFSPSSVSYIMVLAGLGMFVGNLCGGRLADKYSPAKTTLVLLLIMTANLILVYFTSSSQILSLIMTFTTGALAFAIASPIQILMINLAKGAEMLAAAVSQASFNIGNALGAFLGGLPLFFGASYASPELVGAAMSFIGALIVVILLIHAKKSLLNKRPIK